MNWKGETSLFPAYSILEITLSLSMPEFYTGSDILSTPSPEAILELLVDSTGLCKKEKGLAQFLKDLKSDLPDVSSYIYESDAF